MRTVRLAVTTLITGLFALPAMALAQNKAQVYHVDPEPGFEAALENHMEWRAEEGDPWGWDVYQVVQGKHLGEYIIRSDGHSWSDLDSYRGPDGFGAKAGPRFGANVAPLVADVKAYIAQSDTNLVRWPDDAVQHTLFSVTDYHLKPDGGQDWYDAWEQWHEAVESQDADYYHAVINLGPGASGTVRVVSPRENWADFADPAQSVEEVLNAAYDEETTQALFEQFASSFRSTHNMVVRYRPDLSIEGGGDM